MWQFDVAPFLKTFSSIPLGLNQRDFNPGLVCIKRLRITPTISRWSARVEWKILPTLEMGVKKANWKTAAKEMAKRVCLFTACQTSLSRPKHLSHQLDEKISPLHAVTPSATRRPLHRGWMNNGQMSRKCQMFRGCEMFRISTFRAGFDAKFDAESLEKK